MAPKDDLIYAPHEPNSKTGRILLIGVIAAAVILLICVLIAYANGALTSKPATPSPTPHAIKADYTGSFANGAAQCPAPLSKNNTSDICLIEVPVPAGDSSVSANLTWGSHELLGVGLRDAVGKQVRPQVTGTTGTVALAAPGLAGGSYELLVANVAGTSRAINFAVTVTVD